MLVSLQTSFDEHKSAMKKKLDNQAKMFKNFEQTIDAKMKQQLTSLQTYVDPEVGRIQDVEEKVADFEKWFNEQLIFNPDDTVIASNVPYDANENELEKANSLIKDGLHLHGIRIVRSMRLTTKDGKPGLFKIQLGSLEEKKKVLRAKQNIGGHFRFVRLRSSRSHAERLAEQNLRTLLEELPGGNKSRFTANGRIYKRDESTEHYQPGYAYTPSPYRRTNDDRISYTPDGNPHIVDQQAFTPSGVASGHSYTMERSPGDIIQMTQYGTPSNSQRHDTS
jgi:hypothetical protein